jgi:hypothetical protein
MGAGRLSYCVEWDGGKGEMEKVGTMRERGEGGK